MELNQGSRLDQYCAIEAIHKRHALMRVIPVGSNRSGFELVYEFVPREDGLLRESYNAI